MFYNVYIKFYLFHVKIASTPLPFGELYFVGILTAEDITDDLQN